mmetsp:Transcript_3711/g.6946  ORF Transcript_3711/g.6946 Transcript_3711/m.6946 type:complete len:183 (+) Transcript_3711:98-646(+)
METTSRDSVPASSSATVAAQNPDPSDPEESDEELNEEPPDFYDSGADDMDDEWVQKQRQGRPTDAILSCPACLETVCLECQRHAVHAHQYRAMFVQNCDVDTTQRVRMPAQPAQKAKNKNKRQSRDVNSTNDISDNNSDQAGGAEVSDEVYYPVRCAACKTEVGLYDKDEIYHFFHVYPSCS